MVILKCHATPLPAPHPSTGLPDVSETTARIALVQFSSGVDIIFDYDDFNFDRADILAFLTVDNIPHARGKTNTGKALEVVGSTVNQVAAGYVEGVTDVVIVITDGEPTDMGLLSTSAPVSSVTVHAGPPLTREPLGRDGIPAPLVRWSVGPLRVLVSALLNADLAATPKIADVMITHPCVQPFQGLAC